jgi:hypothetical protein
MLSEKPTESMLYGLAVCHSRKGRWIGGGRRKAGDVAPRSRTERHEDQGGEMLCVLAVMVVSQAQTSIKTS